jgi:GntR family transcriptional repressor for pyruvate dehydrogenase complex
MSKPKAHTLSSMKKQQVHRIAPSEVLEHLRQLIMSGNMQSGQRLPPERALAEELGVGRPAIREAIKALQFMDILDSRHGNGTYVKSLAALTGGWMPQVQFSRRNFDLIELFEVRKMLEPGTAALAAARRTEQQLQQIEHELLAQEREPENRDVLVRHDYLFHEEIMRAAANSLLQGITSQLSPLLLKSRKLTGRTTPDPRKVIQQHRMIYEAIRLRDPALAELAMREHLVTNALDLIVSKEGKPD